MTWYMHGVEKQYREVYVYGSTFNWLELEFCSSRLSGHVQATRLSAFTEVV